MSTLSTKIYINKWVLIPMIVELFETERMYLVRRGVTGRTKSKLGLDQEQSYPHLRSRESGRVIRQV